MPQRQQSVRALALVICSLTPCFVSHAAAVVSVDQKVNATGTSPTDDFGAHVALSGDTLVVAAGQETNAGVIGGSAYIFVRSGSTWSLQRKLVSTDPAEGDHFGSAVAISGDTVVVGAQAEDDNGSDTGSVYVYVRSGVTWTLQQKLHAFDGVASDEFGSSVSVDGDTLVVGAGARHDSGTTGYVYVFTRSGTTWSLQQKLTASDGASNDVFGEDVSISGDTLVVGARNNDDAGTSSGSAYVFERIGTSWSQQQKLTAADAAPGDEFGVGVSISSNTVIVGAWHDNDDIAGSNSGSAYVFVRNGSAWLQQQKLTANDGAPNDQFGLSVTIENGTAIVGARTDNPFNSGSAYMFTRTGAVWTQQSTIVAADAEESDLFGFSVAISNGFIAIGSFHGRHAAGISNAGAAYILDISTIRRIAKQPPCVIRTELGAEPQAMSVEVAGAGPFAFQWRKDGLPLDEGGAFSGTTTSSLSVVPALETDGKYDVVITGDLCSVISEPTEFVVSNPIPADIDGSGVVGPVDLALLLSSWRQTR